MPEHAVQAYSKLDGSILQGRMLHLLPAKAKENPVIDDNNSGKYFLSFKPLNNINIKFYCRQFQSETSSEN